MRRICIPNLVSRKLASMVDPKQVSLISVPVSLGQPLLGVDKTPRYGPDSMYITQYHKVILILVYYLIMVL